MSKSFEGFRRRASLTGRASIRVLALVFLTLAGCDDGGGVSGESFVVGQTFAILNNGYRKGEVTWVVVRDWPATSTPEQRLADGRLVLGTDGEYQLRQGGALGPPVGGKAYIFYGNRLATFPVRMKEDDFIGFRTERLKAYSEVEEFLRRFQQGPPP